MLVTQSGDNTVSSLRILQCKLLRSRHFFLIFFLLILSQNGNGLYRVPTHMTLHLDIAIRVAWKGEKRNKKRNKHLYTLADSFHTGIGSRRWQHSRASAGLLHLAPTYVDRHACTYHSAHCPIFSGDIIHGPLNIIERKVNNYKVHTEVEKNMYCLIFLRDELHSILTCIL